MSVDFSGMVISQLPFTAELLNIHVDTSEQGLLLFMRVLLLFVQVLMLVLQVSVFLSTDMMPRVEDSTPNVK